MASVWKDYHQRTAIMTERGEKEVRLIMSDSDGIKVYQVSKSQFEKEFNELIDYDPERAARIYLRVARMTGVTQEGLDELAKVVKLTKEDIPMAKKSLPAAKMSEKAVIHGKAKGTKKVAIAKGEKGGRQPRTGTSAEMYRTLLMAGKLSDQEVFEAVLAEHPTTTRTSVGYYKWQLKKEGKLPEKKK